MADMRYLVIIPALNEERTIAEVITETSRNLPYADILVINDGSRDATADIARGLRARVIDLPFNLGYGAALQTGFRFADRYGYDRVVTMDADGQHIPASIEVMLQTMEREQADVVIGSRFLGESYDPGFLRSVGIWLFSQIARLYTDIRVTDPTSGFQVLSRSAFSYLARGDNYPLDYPDVNIIMALHKRQFKVVEAPVAMKSNPYRKSMHSGLRPLLYVIKMSLAIVMVLFGKEER